MARRSQQIQIRVTPGEKTTLKRLARRAGQDLSSYCRGRTLPGRQAIFDQILCLLRKEEDWRFALAELNDFLSRLAPMQMEEAVQYADLRGLSPLAQNYVAAMVEQAAHQKGVEAPAWTNDVPPLEEPFFGTPFRSLRPYLLKAAPVAFKRRNIFVDAGVGDRV